MEIVKTFTLQEAQFCPWTRRIFCKLPSNNHNHHLITAIIIILCHIIIIILCTKPSHHLSSFSCHIILFISHTRHISTFFSSYISAYSSPAFLIHHSSVLTSYFNVNVFWRQSTIICHLYSLHTFQRILYTSPQPQIQTFTYSTSVLHLSLTRLLFQVRRDPVV